MAEGNDNHQTDKERCYMTVGQRIQNARKMAGLTQKELGQRMGLSYQSIAQWENGLRKPKKETIEKLADALCVSIDTLTGREVPAVPGPMENDPNMAELCFRNGEAHMKEKVIALLMEHKVCTDGVCHRHITQIIQKIEKL
jgi:transcriptional regulator with XRE-family HTH domain